MRSPRAQEVQATRLAPSTMRRDLDDMRNKMSGITQQLDTAMPS
jgi:hypothetical protein